MSQSIYYVPKAVMSRLLYYCSGSENTTGSKLFRDTWNFQRPEFDKVKTPFFKYLASIAAFSFNRNVQMRHIKGICLLFYRRWREKYPEAIEHTDALFLKYLDKKILSRITHNPRNVAIREAVRTTQNAHSRAYKQRAKEKDPEEYRRKKKEQQRAWRAKKK